MSPKDSHHNNLKDVPRILLGKSWESLLGSTRFGLDSVMNWDHAFTEFSSIPRPFCSQTQTLDTTTLVSLFALNKPKRKRATFSNKLLGEFITWADPGWKARQKPPLKTRRGR
jgi:hypothetical protein